MAVRFISLGLLLVLGFIWGSGYSIAKLAMQNGVPPLGYSFWQSLGPALLLLFYVAVSGNKAHLVKRSYWPFFALCGLIGIAIPNTNMYFAAPHLPAGLLSVIVNTVPIMTYPIALMVGVERFDIGRVVAVLIGVIGIMFIVVPDLNFAHLQLNVWSYVALISPLSFALCSVYIAAKSPQGISPVLSSTGMLCTSALILTPMVFGMDAFYSLLPPYDLGKSLVLLEILLSTIGYVLFFTLIKLSGPVFYSLTGGIVALTGLFWGRVIFQEHLSFTDVIAIVLILGSIGILSWRQERGRVE